MVDLYSNTEKLFEQWLERAEHALADENRGAMENSLETLMKRGKEILTTFGDAVEYAKMTDGELSLKESVYDPDQMLHEAVMLQGDAIREKGNRVQIHTPDDASVSFFGDGGRLKYLTTILIKISNSLISNGMMEIHAWTEKVDYADMFVIEVRNNGQGIPQGSMEGLNRYMQHVNVNLPDYTEDEEKDLFVLRMVVEQLSGNIVFKSRPDGGIVTRVVVPQLEMK